MKTYILKNKILKNLSLKLKNIVSLLYKLINKNKLKLKKEHQQTQEIPKIQTKEKQKLKDFIVITTITNHDHVLLNTLGCKRI